MNNMLRKIKYFEWLFSKKIFKVNKKYFTDYETSGEFEFDFVEELGTNHVPFHDLVPN
jgi:hypothetical protein